MKRRNPNSPSIALATILGLLAVAALALTTAETAVLADTRGPPGRPPSPGEGSAKSAGSGPTAGDESGAPTGQDAKRDKDKKDLLRKDLDEGDTSGLDASLGVSERSFDSVLRQRRILALAPGSSRGVEPAPILLAQKSSDGTADEAR